MIESDPFAGLGKALALLRERAGFATQTQASEVTGIDKGQLSRWENESPRPSLENLGRLLAGYKATLGDLVAILEGAAQPSPPAQDRGPTDEELIQSLADAIRRVEGRQVEVEGRFEQRFEQLEKDLGRTSG
jgi:transcriptional regulator with XRE-family HTH domain